MWVNVAFELVRPVTEDVVLDNRDVVFDIEELVLESEEVVEFVYGAELCDEEVTLVISELVELKVEEISLLLVIGSRVLVLLELESVEVVEISLVELETNVVELSLLADEYEEVIELPISLLVDEIEEDVLVPRNNH